MCMYTRMSKLSGQSVRVIFDQMTRFHVAYFMIYFLQMHLVTFLPVKEEEHLVGEPLSSAATGSIRRGFHKAVSRSRPQRPVCRSILYFVFCILYLAVSRFHRSGQCVKIFWISICIRNCIQVCLNCICIHITHLAVSLKIAIFL